MLGAVCAGMNVRIPSASANPQRAIHQSQTASWRAFGGIDLYISFDTIHAPGPSHLKHPRRRPRFIDEHCLAATPTGALLDTSGTMASGSEVGRRPKTKTNESLLREDISAAAAGAKGRG